MTVQGVDDLLLNFGWIAKTDFFDWTQYWWLAVQDAAVWSAGNWRFM
jgi:hypothetical protein